MVILAELLIIALALIIFFEICSYNFKLVAGISVFMIIFQQAFTVILFGATLRVSDVLFVLMTVVIFINKKGTNEDRIQINKKYIFYCLYILIGTVLMTYLLKDRLSAGTIGMHVSQFKKIVSNLFTPCIALSAYVVGGYIVNEYKNINFQRIMRILCNANIILSVYSIIQFVVVNITGKWIKLPGETINENTTFAYGLRRAWGFFIEPGAFGIFLVFNMLIIYLLFNSDMKKKLKTLKINSVAVFCSFSSVAIVSLVVFALTVALFSKQQIVSKNFRIIILALVGIFTVSIFIVPALNQAIVSKIFGGDSFSTKDRMANITMLKRMFSDYPFAGVGYGNFGGLRNLYSKGTLVSFKSFYDIPNVLYYGILGEQGIIGCTFFVLIIKDLYNKLKMSDIHPFIILIPMLVVFSTTSHFNYNYLALGLGIMINANYVKDK